MGQVVVRNPLSIYYTPPEGTTLENAASGIGLSSNGHFLRITFLINPLKVGVSKSKKEKYILTKAGWERNYFTEDLRTYDYSGTTGAFRPDEMDGAKTLEQGSTFQRFVKTSLGRDANVLDITQTKKWKWFKSLEEFFDRVTDGTLILVWWGHSRPTVGSMNEFKFDQSADDPFQIRYSFRFTGIPLDLPIIEGRIKDVDRIQDKL